MIMKTVAITGGIGSGKSVVSRLLRVEGYPVYDCDSQAKRIMDNDAEIQRQLQNAFGEDVVVDGVIHRQKLASVVFGNSENLRKLNAIVHPAVIADIKKWSVAEQKDLVFVETAILRESGMETLVDEVWVVDAPKDIRVARVMVRNNMPEEDVRKRIDSQNDNPKFSVPTSVPYMDEELLEYEHFHLPADCSLRMQSTYAAELLQCYLKYEPDTLSYPVQQHGCQDDVPVHHLS